MKGVKVADCNLVFASQTIYISSSSSTTATLNGVYSSGLPSDCSIENIVKLQCSSVTGFRAESQALISMMYFGYICDIINSSKTQCTTIVNAAFDISGSSTKLQGRSGTVSYRVFYIT